MIPPDLNAALARIARLEAALRDILRVVQAETEGSLLDRVLNAAEAVLEEET
jgi:hypothetical protein